MRLPNSILNLLSYRDVTQMYCVVIHHSVLAPTLDIEDVAAFEEKNFNFTTVGYNAYVKLVDEKNDKWIMQFGRPINKLPAATLGFNNESYNICIGGNYQPGATTFLTPVSNNALGLVAGQIHAVKEKYSWVNYIIGHRDVATLMKAEGGDPAYYATACPGDNLYNRLPDLCKMTGLQKLTTLL